MATVITPVPPGVAQRAAARTALAALAGAAAAIWPSRRAAKLNILHAIVTE